MAWITTGNGLQYLSPTPTGDAGIVLNENVTVIDGLITSINGSIASVVASVAGCLAKANNLSDLGNAAAARTNLGLGTAATQNSSAFDAAGAASTAQAASLQKASNLSDLSSAATARGNLGLGSAATQASTAFLSATATEPANAFLGGPLSGPNAAPTYRLLNADDIPSSLNSLTLLSNTLEFNGGSSVNDDGSGNLILSGGQVSTNNNTLDDGSGNMTVNGTRLIFTPPSDGNFFVDNTSAAGAGIIAGYNSAKASSLSRIFQVYDNATDRNLILSCNSGAGDGSKSAVQVFPFSSSAAKFGIGDVTPNAMLHVAAGSAAAGNSPIKLTAGTNLTTPESGAFEFDGTHLYFTIGSTRHTLI